MRKKFPFQKILLCVYIYFYLGLLLLSALQKL